MGKFLLAPHDVTNTSVTLWVAALDEAPPLDLQPTPKLSGEKPPSNVGQWPSLAQAPRLRHHEIVVEGSRRAANLGPISRSADLVSYADYLEDLDTQVCRSVKAGMSEDETTRRVDLTRWQLQTLPPFPDNRFIPEWTSADRNVRADYALVSAEGH